MKTVAAGLFVAAIPIGLLGAVAAANASDTDISLAGFIYLIAQTNFVGLLIASTIVNNKADEAYNN